MPCARRKLMSECRAGHGAWAQAIHHRSLSLARRRPASLGGSTRGPGGRHEAHDDADRVATHISHEPCPAHTEHVDRRLGPRAGACLASVVGRRRRRELLDPRLLRKPGGGSSPAGLDPPDQLLPYQRIGRRRGGAGARDHDRENPGHAQRQPERDARCKGRSGLGDATLYLRHAGSRRPGDRWRARNVWPRQHVARGDAGRYLGNAIGNVPVLALRQHQRCGVGLRRRDPDSDAALECGRAQLHDLYHWRYPGRGLRLRPSVESRDRARGDRRRRRLHLLQSADRARALGRAGLHLQFREPVDPVSERRRHAFRLERVAVRDQAVPDRSGGLRLQGDRLRQRLRRPRGLLPVTGDRGWSAARLHLSGRRPAGLSQSEVLQRVRGGESSPRLEHLGHVHDLAACTHADRATATNDHEITPDTEPTSPNAAPYSAVPKAVCCVRQPNSIGRETSRLKFRSLHYFALDQFRLGALRRKIIYDRLHVVRPSIIQPCGGSGSAVQRFALHSIRDTYLGEDEIMKTITFAFAALTVAVLAFVPAFGQQTTGVPGSPAATTTIEGNQLPPLPPKFGGKIERNAAQSTPYWPPRVVPPEGAPNVLLIMTDDTGFGVSSTFGGVIPTPNLDRIAANGLRYTNFNSTALCSPSRAAIITGRNHHSMGFGVISEQSTGYPGYNSIMTRDKATIGKILKDHGYWTSWFGKDHNTPEFQASQAGPFDQWPVGMGFDYFYGFVGGDANQWQPNLFRNTTPIYPYVGKSGWNLITAMADDAIEYMNRITAVNPDQPFFIYYVPGGVHAPHHPTPEWIKKISDMRLFDEGWNKLRDTIFANQKKLGVIPQDAKLAP